MRLLETFFRANPINPSQRIVLDLSGNESYTEDRLFIPGHYRFEVQAGASYGSGNDSAGVSGRIDVNITIYDQFKVVAYCGSKATASAAGINPYSGSYKVNSYTSFSDVPSVSHIFGNSGSLSRLVSGSGSAYSYGSGNCLGNGARYSGSYETCSIGAGSCLHLLPSTGMFGTDYIHAFHTTAGSSGNGFCMGGTGSAYGGAGSGKSNNLTTSSRSYNGGSTPFGMGGAGVAVPTVNPSAANGNSGTGIGAGIGGGLIKNGFITPGAAAYFDGSNWIDANTYAALSADGKIRITFMEPL